MDIATLKILLTMLVPAIDGIVQKTKTKLDDMAWEIIKPILLAKGPEIAESLHKEMVAKGMAPKSIDNVT